MLSVKKNRLISRNLSLDGLSEGPMNRGNPPIPGENCMKLSQNLPDRYSVAQLTQHGTKVKKWFRDGQLVRMGRAAFGKANAAVRSGGEQNGFIRTPGITCTDIRYVPRSSLRLVVFFHYPILSEVVAVLFTEQVPRLISLEDLPLGGVARIVMCLLSFSF